MPQDDTYLTLESIIVFALITGTLFEERNLISDIVSQNIIAERSILVLGHVLDDKRPNGQIEIVAGLLMCEKKDDQRCPGLTSNHNNGIQVKNNKLNKNGLTRT